MIKSIVISFQYLGEDKKRIKKYQNYKELEALFLASSISKEEYKNLRISNFITKDRNFLYAHHYSIKISTLSSNLFLKILKIIFLKNLLKEEFNLYGELFIIKNIVFHHKYSREFRFIKMKNLPTKVLFKLITPVTFKIGEKIFTSTDAKYIYNNLLTNIKKSDFKNQFLYFKNFPLDKVKTINKEIREVNSNEAYKGIIGKIEVNLDDEITEKEKFIFYFLSSFAFFSGLGFQTHRGYGQVDIEFLN